MRFQCWLLFCNLGMIKLQYSKYSVCGLTLWHVTAAYYGLGLDDTYNLVKQGGFCPDPAYGRFPNIWSGWDEAARNFWISKMINKLNIRETEHWIIPMGLKHKRRSSCVLPIMLLVPLLLFRLDHVWSRLR